MNSIETILGTSRQPDLILVNSPLKDYDRYPRRNAFTLPTLGLGYIATCAEAAGFSVGLIDAEALGLGVQKTAQLINSAQPRWLGMNLLAPTYNVSRDILRSVDTSIHVMLGGHHAKAMPNRILADELIPRIDALVIGEAESRVTRLLESLSERCHLPHVYWRGSDSPSFSRLGRGASSWLAPDINAMPLVNRGFLPQDPYMDQGALESAMVASRGCPFDCSFCGAAVSANPDVTIRTRHPENILHEMRQLKTQYGVQRVRFVDDLFLSNRKVMTETLGAFAASAANIRWDATGRINVLSTATDELIELMVESGGREIALGIESGSDRVLSYIDKRISVRQAKTVVQRLCSVGLNVKGYFMLGLPTESKQEHAETLALIENLWEVTANLRGRFRCSVFEYRPYPGTPDWTRLLLSGFSEERMLYYDASSLDKETASLDLLERDEFNFSTGLQFGEVAVADIRTSVANIMNKQKQQ